MFLCDNGRLAASTSRRAEQRHRSANRPNLHQQQDDLLPSAEPPMKFDPEKFKETLPYSSELFGVYQPLIGWKSRLISVRLRHERQRVHQLAAARLVREQSRMLAYSPQGLPATSATAAAVYPPPALDCCVARFVVAALKLGSA